MDTAIILAMKINFENFDLMALLAWRVSLHIYNNLNVFTFVIKALLKTYIKSIIVSFDV